MADPTTDDVTALGTLLAGEVDGAVDELAAYILASSWLARHDARVRAEAWDEGYTRGFYDREVMPGEVRDASEGPSENPYREARP